MTIRYYAEVEQGSDEWLELRRGLLTASEMNLIVTPTLQVANNEKTRAHVYELLAQRISGYVEPHYVGDHMLRGKEEEILARSFYEQKYVQPVKAKLRTVGFVTNDKWGFKIGYSPDGLVEDHEPGQIECKSRRQKFQVETIVTDQMPAEYVIQVQTGLLVTERPWCDFVSYSGGLPMLVKRIYPDPDIQAAIVKAATQFEQQIETKMNAYTANLVKNAARLTQTPRTIVQEMFV
jgi:predicted phage-related endonuclease